MLKQGPHFYFEIRLGLGLVEITRVDCVSYKISQVLNPTIKLNVTPPYPNSQLSKFNCNKGRSTVVYSTKGEMTGGTSRN